MNSGYFEYFILERPGGGGITPRNTNPVGVLLKLTSPSLKEEWKMFKKWALEGKFELFQKSTILKDSKIHILILEIMRAYFTMRKDHSRLFQVNNIILI